MHIPEFIRNAVAVYGKSVKSYGEEPLEVVVNERGQAPAFVTLKDKKIHLVLDQIEQLLRRMGIRSEIEKEIVVLFLLLHEHGHIYYNVEKYTQVALDVLRRLHSDVNVSLLQQIAMQISNVTHDFLVNAVASARLVNDISLKRYGLKAYKILGLFSTLKSLKNLVVFPETLPNFVSGIVDEENYDKAIREINDVLSKDDLSLEDKVLWMTEIIARYAKVQKPDLFPWGGGDIEGEDSNGGDTEGESVTLDPTKEGPKPPKDDTEEGGDDDLTTVGFAAALGSLSELSRETAEIPIDEFVTRIRPRRQKRYDIFTFVPEEQSIKESLGQPIKLYGKKQFRGDPHVYAIIDTSSSMSDKELLAVMKAVNYIADKLNYKCTFVFFSVGFKVIEGKNCKETMKKAREYLSGLFLRGGTEPVPAIKWTIENMQRYSVVIVFSDFIWSESDYAFIEKAYEAVRKKNGVLVLATVSRLPPFVPKSVPLFEYVPEKNKFVRLK